MVPTSLTLTLQTNHKSMQVLFVSSNKSGSLINVTSPPYLCATCRYTSGVARVELSVGLHGNTQIFAQATYSYYVAPEIVRARFLRLGDGIEVIFDSNTDMGGQPVSAPCAPFFLEMTSLGLLAPTCTWETPAHLIVHFGPSPTIVPGSVLTLSPNVIRSASLQSVASPSVSITVHGPSALRPLTPATIRGPSEIDTCSPYEVSVGVVSPRPLTFQWRCLDDQDLDSFLLTWR
jgi:hypothetical protein